MGKIMLNGVEYSSGGGGISDFTPPTTQAAGVHGLVPAPATIEKLNNKLFLLSDGTWAFKGHYEDANMKNDDVSPMNFYLDGNGEPVVVTEWTPQHKVVEADFDAGGISYELLANDNYQTQRAIPPNTYIGEFTNKNIYFEVTSNDAYTRNEYGIPTGENSVSMDITAGDIELSSKWDGTNTSLKAAVNKHNTVQTAAWTASSTSAIGTAVTGTVNVEEGKKYLIILKVPVSGATHYYNVGSEVVGIADQGTGTIVYTATANGTLQATSGESAPVSYTYTDRGKITAIELVK